MAKSGITWKYTSPDGEERQASAERVAGRWVFRSRVGRYDQWELNGSPSLEDWLALLDGVRRRIGRQLVKPEEERNVLDRIRERFPDAEIPRA